MAFWDCFPSSPLFFSPRLTPPFLPALPWTQHGWVRPVTAEGPLPFTISPAEEILQQSMTTFQQKLTKSNLGEQGNKKGNRKVIGFSNHCHWQSTNQMETMRVYYQMGSYSGKNIYSRVIMRRRKKSLA